MSSNKSPAFDVLSASGRELYLRALHEPDGWQESLVRLRDDIVRAFQKPGTPEMARGEVTNQQFEALPEWHAVYAAMNTLVKEAHEHDHSQCAILIFDGAMRKFARRILALRESQAPEAERDITSSVPSETDLAYQRGVMAERKKWERRASLDKEEGARDVLERCAKAMAEGCAGSRSSSECKYWIRVADHVRDYLDREYPAPKPAECRMSDGSVVTWVKNMVGDQRLLRHNGDGDPNKELPLTLPANWPSLLVPTDTGADFDALKAFAATRTEDTTDE